MKTDINITIERKLTWNDLRRYYELMLKVQGLTGLNLIMIFYYNLDILEKIYKQTEFSYQYRNDEYDRYVVTRNIFISQYFAKNNLPIKTIKGEDNKIYEYYDEQYYNDEIRAELTRLENLNAAAIDKYQVNKEKWLNDLKETVPYTFLTNFKIISIEEIKEITQEQYNVIRWFINDMQATNKFANP